MLSPDPNLELRIPVTREDIAQGVPGCPESCAIAQALRRRFDQVQVHIDQIRVSDDHADTDHHQYNFSATAGVANWSRHFDARHPVEPFDLLLDFAKGRARYAQPGANTQAS